jgi:TAZ zinc finger
MFLSHVSRLTKSIVRLRSTFLQNSLNIEKLALRYENIIYQEAESLECYNNEDYVNSKIQYLLRHDTPALIVDDIFSFLFTDNNNSNKPSVSFDDGGTEDDKDDTSHDVIYPTGLPVNDPTTSDQIVEAYRTQTTTLTTTSASPTKEIGSPTKLDIVSLSSLSHPTRLFETSSHDTTSRKRQKRHPHEKEHGKENNITLRTKRLFELYHATKCTHNYKDAPVLPCPESKHCINMKKLWDHMEHCHENLCTYRHCHSSRMVLTHYQNCQQKRCPICSSFRQHTDAVVKKSTTATSNSTTTTTTTTPRKKQPDMYLESRSSLNTMLSYSTWSPPPRHNHQCSNIHESHHAYATPESERSSAGYDSSERNNDGWSHPLPRIEETTILESVS